MLNSKDFIISPYLSNDVMESFLRDQTSQITPEKGILQLLGHRVFRD